MADSRTSHKAESRRHFGVEPLPLQHMEHDNYGWLFVPVGLVIFGLICLAMGIYGTVFP